MKRKVKIDGTMYPYDDAITDVVLDRTMLHVLKAKPGKDGECMNAQCIMDNRTAFPHPVLATSVIASRVYILDTLEHAVRYTISAKDRELIHNHDELQVGEPGTLTLYAPAGRTVGGTAHGTGPGGNTRTTSNGHPLSRGAKARLKVAVGALNAR